MTGSPGSFAPRVGERFAGRFELRTLLRGGGPAQVFLASDGSGQQVPLVLLDPACCGPAAWASFVRVVTAATTAGVAGLASLRDVYATPSDPPYCFADPPSGRGFDRLRQDGGPVSWQMALGLGERVAAIVHAIHGVTGAAHCALQAARCVVDEAQDVKVLDYGIGELEPAAGRPDDASYRAPEQFSGRGDHRSDVYSLAAILFELITGQRPSARLAPRLRSLVPGVPRPVDELFARALAREPARRHPDLGALRGEFREILGLAPDANPPTKAAALLASPSSPARVEPSPAAAPPQPEPSLLGAAAGPVGDPSRLSPPPAGPAGDPVASLVALLRAPAGPAAAPQQSSQSRAPADNVVPAAAESTPRAPAFVAAEPPMVASPSPASPAIVKGLAPLEFSPSSRTPPLEPAAQRSSARLQGLTPQPAGKPVQESLPPLESARPAELRRDPPAARSAARLGLLPSEPATLAGKTELLPGNAPAGDKTEMFPGAAPSDGKTEMFPGAAPSDGRTEIFPRAPGGAAMPQRTMLLADAQQGPASLDPANGNRTEVFPRAPGGVNPERTMLLSDVQPGPASLDSTNGNRTEVFPRAPGPDIRAAVDNRALAGARSDSTLLLPDAGEPVAPRVVVHLAESPPQQRSAPLAVASSDRAVAPRSSAIKKLALIAATVVLGVLLVALLLAGL